MAEGAQWWTTGHARPVALALVGVLTLAGCGEGRQGARSPFGQFVRGSTAEPTTLPPLEANRPIACPRVTIQPETETLRRDDGSGAASALSWQATITRTARECSPQGDGVAIRVGLSGRVVAGPRGAPSSVVLPLRVAVREGGEVTRSNVRSVSVSLSGQSASWAYVEESIVVADGRRAQILVGFD